MSRFFEETSAREEKAAPLTMWILKGVLKADMEAVSASQASSDSMQVDEGETNLPLARESLLLVSQEKVKETESLFDRINVRQIYSFSPSLPVKCTEAHKVAAASQLTTIQHELHSKKEYVDIWEGSERGVQLGTVQAAELVKDAGKPTLVEQKAGPSKISSGKVETVVKREQQVKTTIEEKKGATKVAENGSGTAKSADKLKAKLEPKMESKTKSKAKRKLVDSEDEEEDKEASTVNNREKEGDDEEEEEEEDTGPIGYADETQSASRKRADAGGKISAEEEKKRKRKQELMDMMDEPGDADPPDIKISTSASTNMMRGTADTPNVQTHHDGDDAEQEREAEAGPKKKERVRKQRKVFKKKTTKDERGYRKTIDVEEYESYSSEESDAPLPAPKISAQPPKKESQSMARTNSGGQTNGNNAPSNKKTASGAGAGVAGQRKLSSFFSKGSKDKTK
ncbi:hypothetical protein CBS101457_002107 [Exobasidium rhododendri]|nr:hypothetical protein CBS101457_002107 [Exobasidium rhododendri]